MIRTCRRVTSTLALSLAPLTIVSSAAEPPSASPLVKVVPEVRKTQLAKEIPVTNARNRIKRHFYERSQRGNRTRAFGTFLQSAMQGQIDNGLAARLILYRFDFGSGYFVKPEELNARGHRQLQRLIPLLSRTHFPLVVEATGNRHLDAARIYQVRSVLARYAVVSRDRVQLQGTHRFPGGVRGSEAALVFDNLLRQTADRGSRSAGSTNNRPQRSRTPVAGQRSSQ